MVHTPNFAPAFTQERQMALIERCKQGEAKAQKQLYDRYVRAMFRIALRMTGDSMEAEDVLQESFVRAFRNLHSFKGDATFGAWLKRIVINTSINHIKKRRMDTVNVEAEQIELVEDQPRTNPYGWNMDQILQAVYALPEGYRKVFQLYQMEGYDHKEIGSILNISEATSKSQFSRAKKKLREMLARTATASHEFAC
ncbi:RNA polymerase sigma factor [Pontibacter sp. G13]|uniref:RNA polymerase sigma factor n=1 Tax=Pontibacter sp. G13 TaxID=3074898 RepID=UPI0028895D5A|nr:RNA polymerase sigma factor [Pontibacter sp. G13]WNJ20758.1 RNA polymerase sigma factor [Pontibacter sp. G13]